MSKDDDEDTWRRLIPKPPRGDDERVSIRREAKRMTDSQRRTGRADAIPLSDSDAINLDDWTSPIDLYEREPNASENEIVKRLRRDSDIAKLSEFVGKLAYRLERQRQDERSGNETRGNQLAELLNRPPNEVAVRIQKEMASIHNELDDVKRFRKAALWALGVIATAAFGGLGTAIKGLYDRGYGEGADAVRIQQIEREYERFERQYDRDRRQDAFPPPSIK